MRGLGSAVRAWWDAVSAGHFYTRWSAALSFVVAGFFSIPAIGEPSLFGYLLGVTIAVLGWIPLAVALVPVAYAERRLRSRTARGLLVLAALAVAAIARVFVNDAISVALLDQSTQGSWVSRGATNLLTGLALFSLVAITTAHHRARAASTHRLHVALARLHAAEASTLAAEGEARALIVSAVADLRTARERMLDGVVDFDAVSAYSAEVRAASHRFDALARRPLVMPDTGSLRMPEPPHPSFLSRLGPTPWLSVGFVYVLACLPFALAAGGLRAALLAAAGVSLIDVVAGLLLRRTRGLSPSTRGLAFLAVWLLAGAGVLAVTFAVLPDVGSLGLVPTLAVPLAATLISVCLDALRRARDERAHAERALAALALVVADVEVRPRVPLRRAVELLHGRVQGRCVMFAALVDEDDDAPGDRAAALRAFRTATDEAFDEILRFGAVVAVIDDGSGIGELTRLLSAWRTVVAVTEHIDADARVLLHDPAVAAMVVEVVNEALVNAVKHSSARTAEITISHAVPTGLRVRIDSPGLLPVVRRSGLGSSNAITLRQDGSLVVVEATVA